MNAPNRVRHWIVRPAATLFGVALLLQGGAAAAQQAVDCQVQLSPPLLDYGSNSRGSLLDHVGQAEAVLPPRTATLTVQCPRRASVAVSYQGQALDLDRYRFGAGSLQLRVLSAQVDGAASLLVVEGAGAVADAQPVLAVRPGESFGPGDSAGRAVGTHFSFEIEAQPRLPATATQVAEVTQLESIGRFEVKAVAQP